MDCSDAADDQSIASGRSKRQKIDKGGRFAALERLRQLKGSGSKNKYEVKEVDNVYDEVDERDYAEKVLRRQEDNFIVDDDGAGYAEDGREIFDDDLYVHEETSKSNKKSNNKSRRRTNDDENEGPASSKRHKASGGDIRKLIGNISHAALKKKATDVKKLDEDNDLQDILKELESSPSEVKSKNGTMQRMVTKQSNEISNSVLPSNHSSSISSRDSAREYLKSFTPVSRPKVDNSLEISHARSLNHSTSTYSVKSEPIATNLKDEEISVVPVQETITIKQEILDDEIESGLTLDFGEDDFAVNKTEIKVKREDDMEIHFDESMDFDLSAYETAQAANVNKVDDTNIKTEFKSNIDEWDSVIKPSNIPTNADPGTIPLLEPTQLPLVENEQLGKVLYFYYLDAHEEYFQQPGVVYLFGKVWDEGSKAYHSCCVAVKDIERNVYFLPREERIDVNTGNATGKLVSMQDVYEEFDKLVSNTYKILKYKCRKVSKNYAFNLTDVPLSSEYLQVKYSAKYPKLPADVRGETFSRVFGVNSSFMELLLLDCKIKGPRWLAIKNPEPVKSRISWCRFEVCCIPDDLCTADKVSELNNKSAPHLTVLTLSLRIVFNKRTGNNEIICISGLVHSKFPLDGVAPKPPFQQHFCAMTKLSDRPWPLNLKNELAKQESISLHLEKCDSERAILNYFMARLCRIDPDLIVCHDFVDFELGVLLKKLTDHKIPNWSRLGRLRRSKPVQGRTQIIRSSMCGRLVCDMKMCAKELIRARSYDLDSLCQEVLGMKEGTHESYNQDEVLEMLSDASRMIRLLKATVLDATYILRLMVDLNVLPLALQITNIAGNVISRTLMGGRSERNEFLLLHAFNDKGYIVPEKDFKNANKDKEEQMNSEDEGDGASNTVSGDHKTNKASRSSRRKPAYAGGLVLEPKKGLYDRLVLLMDFNSLYPSIVQEYNICFTTIDHNRQQDITLLSLPESDSKLGILPSEIRQLVESRRVVKSMMKNSNISTDLKLQYEIRQLALKLMANSMYGCLGFANSRFCCKPLAALITSKGREILVKTKDLVEKMGYEVVYGDTDSLMINTNNMDYAEVKKIGHKIKAEVNRCYKQLELDIDGIFRCLLLCKKKKYAASVITGVNQDGSFQLKQEIKGLDVVRRDWCQVSSESGKFILAQILSEQETDERVENIHKHLRQLRDDLQQGKVPLALLTIAKQLAKAPEEYSDKKSQPHVQVALRANHKCGQKRFKAGDTVHYIICQDGTNNSSTQRAYLIEELKTNSDLEVDTKYYLEQQILPVISRICEPIDGAEPARIADTLGLDYKQYEKAVVTNQDDYVDQMVSSSKQTDKFNNCEKFAFKCIKCGTDNIVDGPTRKLDIGVEVSIFNRCANSECAVQPRQYITSIRNSISLCMRGFIKKYYQSWLKCEDPYCTNRKRRLSLLRKCGNPICDSCAKQRTTNILKAEYTDHELYTQLVYFSSIFDSSKVPSSVKIDTELLAIYAKLQDDVKNILNLSAYSLVNLSTLFCLLKPFVKNEVI